MTDIASLLEMALVFAATATPIALAIRLLAGWSADVDSLVTVPPMGWPKGVQEEDVKPWRFGTAAA